MSTTVAPDATGERREETEPAPGRDVGRQRQRQADEHLDHPSAGKVGAGDEPGHRGADHQAQRRDHGGEPEGPNRQLEGPRRASSVSPTGVPPALGGAHHQVDERQRSRRRIATHRADHEGRGARRARRWRRRDGDGAAPPRRRSGRSAQQPLLGEQRLGGLERLEVGEVDRRALRARRAAARPRGRRCRRPPGTRRSRSRSRSGRPRDSRYSTSSSDAGLSAPVLVMPTAVAFTSPPGSSPFGNTSSATSSSPSSGTLRAQ